MKKTVYIARLLLIAGISLSNLTALDIKTDYDTSYYEKYSTKTKSLSDSPYSQTTNFFIDSGRLSADGIFYTLGGAKEIVLNPQTLKEYDLRTVIVEIESTYYKAKPSFKKLYFSASGKKSGFGYSTSKELVLVYVPYGDMIQVLGVISQGQFIEENRKRDYNINAYKKAKKEVLLKTLKLLGCQNPRECDVKSNRDGDNFFYKNGKLIGTMENFGSQKVLIQKSSKKDKKLATIQMAKGGKILMSDSRGNIIYNFNGSKKIKIKLEALDYTIGVEVRNLIER